MLSPRGRVIGLWCLGLLGVGSCAVFPDEATLPIHGAAGGTAGESVAPKAGTAGSGAVGVIPEGGAGAGEGGTPSSGAVSAQAGAGGEPSVIGGVGGVGGAPALPCSNPSQQVIPITTDAWIEAAKPGANHGGDVMLSVVAGDAERRALLSFEAPALPAGRVLQSAVLSLYLASNADVTGAQRKLKLFNLQQDFAVGKVDWNNYGNGAPRKWAMPGGDYDKTLAVVALPAGKSSGLLPFDLTVALQKLAGAAAIPLSVIAIEVSSAPAAPAELAFVSSEGETSKRPALILELCDQ